METLLTNFLSEQSTAHILILLVAFIVFYFFLRREIRHEVKTNIEPIKENMKSHTIQLMAEIKPIKEALTNHITDTDKKIDTLNQDMKNGFTTLSTRIDDLYKLLLKDKDKDQK